ncbi:MAG TPA: TonB-dependent receptor, partial [Longimicrobiales bacterium]
MSNALRTLGWGPARVAAALIAAACTLPAAAAAQQASLQGVVVSSSTGSPLEGVAVLLESGGRQAYAALTDRNGFYQIGAIRPGTYTLRGQQLGYRLHQQALTLAAGERGRVNLRLELAPVELQGIEVAPEKSAAMRDLGRQVVTPLDLRRVPVPAGAGDLATYLQTLPGVATTSDRGGQVFVRGGTPAENLVLVDGLPIFQPFHIVGFFSVFPEDLVSSADFYASGFG